MKSFFWGLFVWALLPVNLVFAEELIIFSMPGCRPCERLKAMLEENPELLQGFDVSMVDITKDAETAKLFKVSTVPTIVRLNDQTHETGRKVGLMNKKEMLEWLEATDK